MCIYIYIYRSIGTHMRQVTKQKSRLGDPEPEKESCVFSKDRREEVWSKRLVCFKFNWLTIWWFQLFIFFNLRQKIWRMIHTCAIFKGVAPHQHKEKSMRMWFIHCWGTVPQVRPIWPSSMSSRNIGVCVCARETSDIAPCYDMLWPLW